MIRSTDEWEMSRSCQRATFSRGDGVAAQDAGEAGESLPGDGIALVRHGAGAFLSLGERLLGFEDFRALQMAEFNRPTLNASADERQRGLEFGMDVALDNLCGDGRGLQAELFADEVLNIGRQMRVGADGAGKFADGGDFAGAVEAFERAAKFVVHERKLEAERGRFAVDAMAAADAGRHLIFLRAPGDDGQ